MPLYNAPMKWASFVSEEPDLEVAVQQAASEIGAEMGSVEPDLLLAFVSPHHEDDYPDVPALLRRYYPDVLSVGCSGGGVVGGGREVEHSAAISLMAASLPGVDLCPFRLDPTDGQRLVGDPGGWQALLGLESDESAHFVLLPDPFSSDARRLIESLDIAFPTSAKIGGLASGAQRPGDNALFLDDTVFPDGIVGLAIRGDIHMDTIVAQGCRPIGSPLFVTRAFRNRILELDGQRPTDVLTELFAELAEDDQRLFRHALSIGVVMHSDQEVYEHGDFLVRNIVGLDPDTGLIAVGEHVQPGQVVQFHLRDAATSARDLESLLVGYKSRAGATPDAVLLFSCLGRGETLYGEPDHDSRVIAEHLGPAPIAGFFCSGEIGPVNRRTFLHGYTSSIAVFRAPGAGAA